MGVVFPLIQKKVSLRSLLLYCIFNQRSMKNLKKCFYVLMLIAIGMAVASCNNTSVTDVPPDKSAFKQPVSEPLIFSKPQKIDWAAIKATPVKPVVKKFDLNKLPVEPYDISGFKQFKYPIEETKFDINSLPGKDLDIDKIPSKPLKFKTYILPPPKPIKTTPPRLKDTSLSLFEFGEAQGLGSNGANCLFKDRDGFMWIDNDEGLYRYDGESLLLYLPMHPVNYIKQMTQDKIGRLWMTVANEGLEVLDPIAGTVSKTNMALGLGSNNPNGIFEDSQQRIWITTSQPGGVNIIDPKTQTVKWLDKARGLSGKDMYESIIQDKHNDGRNVIDLEKKKITYFSNTQGLGSNVDHLFLDNQGRILMGLHGGIIATLDIQKGTLQFTKEGQIQDPGTNADIYKLAQDNKGSTWFGTAKNGVVTIDPEKRAVRKLQISSGLNGNTVTGIQLDGQGQVWVATLTGLNIFGNKEAITGHIGKTPTTTLAEDRQGLVWQGSFYNGINIIDRKTETTRRLNKSYGLANDTMDFIREINGQMFIGTNKGLDIIDS
jgi:ligand-binding sensor domain-containing protein